MAYICSLGVITRHFICVLLLWYLDDNNWKHANCNNNEEDGPDPPSPPDNDGTLPNSSMEVSSSSKVSTTIFSSSSDPTSLLNAGTATDQNFKRPTAVYIAVPVLSLMLGIFSIASYCSWKIKLLKSRKKRQERVVRRRRKTSIKPGSGAQIERSKKFGLERDLSSEFAPEASTSISVPSALLDLAIELENIEKLVLEFQSLDSGGTFQASRRVITSNEELFNVNINPLYNSLQSGACGYVLSGAHLQEQQRRSTLSIHMPPQLDPPEQDESKSSDESPRSRESRSTHESTYLSRPHSHDRGDRSADKKIDSHHEDESGSSSDGNSPGSTTTVVESTRSGSPRSSSPQSPTSSSKRRKERSPSSSSRRGSSKKTKDDDNYSESSDKDFSGSTTQSPTSGVSSKSPPSGPSSDPQSPSSSSKSPEERRPSSRRRSGSMDRARKAKYPIQDESSSDENSTTLGGSGPSSVPQSPNNSKKSLRESRPSSSRRPL